MDIIDWHSGFTPALKLDFRENENDLEYEEEHYVANRAQKLDLLIIKNDHRIKIKNTVGRIFGRFNILEYKGPGDELNIGSIFKTIAYTCLYLEERHEYDKDDSRSYSISLVRYAYPKKLFELLPRYGIRIVRRFSGIYELTGRMQFRTQVVVIRDLPNDSRHVWLKCLTNSGGEKELRNILTYTPGLTPIQKTYADNVMDIFIRANNAAVTRMIKNGRKNKMCKAVNELFADEIQELKNEVKSKDAQIASLKAEQKNQSDKIAELEKRLAAYGG